VFRDLNLSIKIHNQNIDVAFKDPSFQGRIKGMQVDRWSVKKKILKKI